MRKEAGQIQGDTTQPVSTWCADTLVTSSSERTRCNCCIVGRLWGWENNFVFLVSCFLACIGHMLTPWVFTPFHFRVAPVRVENESWARDEG